MQGSSVSNSNLDTGLACLVMLARFHQVPADPEQLRRQFADGDQPLSETDLLRAAKALGFKAREMRSTFSRLRDEVIPAIARAQDGTYFIIARIAQANGDQPAKALIQRQGATAPQ